MAKACIGLDLGSSSVKMAQVTAPKRGGEAKLIAFGVEPLVPDSIVDGTIMNQSAVVDAVRALAARLKIKTKDVALAISGHSVIIKKIAVPAMTEQELEEQIPWEAEQHIPFDKNDVEIDYQILSGKNAQGQMEVLLVAAKKEVVRDYTAVAREAQLNPVVVDIAAFALQNAFELAYHPPGEPPPPPEEAVALINVGAAISHINILAGGTTTFTRDVNAGGNAFTEEIKRQLGVSHEEAEAMKLATAETEDDGEVGRVLRHVAEQMAGEFSKSLDFFLASHRDTNVTRIYLAGGGARVASLHRAIANRAHTPVELMDPFKRVNVDGARVEVGAIDRFRTAGAIAIGLALRTPGDKFE